MKILGVVMAGGRNSRFGDIKAFAQVAGTRIIDRVIIALGAVSDAVVLSANDAATYSSTGLEMRGDVVPDIGALGGIHAALMWAKERGDDGVIVAACDMPFPSIPLLEAIRDAAASHDAVLPESDGRRGIEPLFGFYSVRCLPAIDAAIARDDRRMISFHGDIDLHIIPLEMVRTFGDPGVLFMNVNTRDELEQAERIARGAA
ncbi:MAG TPA: molybdenum cofactor guanylyltransferase [Longimicrobiales bacterium]